MHSLLVGRLSATIQLLQFCVFESIHQSIYCISITGNCVVLKPSEIAAHTGELLTKLVPKYLDKVCITPGSSRSMSSSEQTDRTGPLY